MELLTSYFFPPETLLGISSQALVQAACPTSQQGQVATRINNKDIYGQGFRADDPDLASPYLFASALFFPTDKHLGTCLDLPDLPSLPTRPNLPT